MVSDETGLYGEPRSGDGSSKVDEGGVRVCEVEVTDETGQYGERSSDNAAPAVPCKRWGIGEMLIM